LTNAIKCSSISAWSQTVNTDNIFDAIHDRNSLQQGHITELMETKYSVSTL